MRSLIVRWCIRQRSKAVNDLTLEYAPRRAGNITPEDTALIEEMLGPEDDGKSVVSALGKVGLNVAPAKELVATLVADHFEPAVED
jgi:hypothetical protein